MRRGLSLALAAACCAFVVASPATAAVHNLSAVIDGSQERPPNASPGTGSATMTLDDVSNMFTLTGSFSGLTGTTNNAHVHGPSPLGGAAAGVLFGITYTPGVTAGNISFNGVISAAHRDIILAGNAYINIHTSTFPGGEIAGQIVPEPASLVLIGLSSLALCRRRTRT